MRLLPLLLFALILTNSVAAPVHNVNKAIFELSQAEEGGFQLSIQFDRSYLLEALFGNCQDFSVPQPCFDEYVQERVTLQFDSQEIPITVLEHQMDDHYIYLTYTLDTQVIEVNRIDVEITTLLGVENQYNIFRVMFGPRVRSFQLTKDRIKTHLTI